MGLLDMLQGNGGSGGGDELSNGAGNFLSALGAGLLTGNRFQPIGPGFGQRMDQINKLAVAQGDKASIAALLKLYGFTDQEALSLASNPKAAELAIAKKQLDTNNAQTASALAGAPGLGNLFGGAGDGASPVPGMSPAAPAGPAAGASLNGDQTASAKTIYDGVIARGGSPMLASAVVGNFAKESSFDPAIGGDHRNGVPTSFGLGQWREGRLDALKALGQEQGKDWRTTDVQLDHLFKELNGGDAGAARARALIEQARTPEEAAAIFARHFERPSAEALSNSLPGRQGVAAQAFRSFGQGAPTRVADASGRIGAPAAAGDGTAIQTEAGPVAFRPSAVPQDPGTETERSGRPPDAAGINAARRDFFRGGVPPVGSGSVLPPPPPQPRNGARRAVDVAETEEDVQRLEGRQSMYPPNVYGATPELQRPQTTRVAEAGAADMPAPGASDAGFYVPGVNGQPGRTYTGTSARIMQDREARAQDRAVSSAPPTPEAVRGETSRRAAAMRHYGYWSGQLARAGSNKPLAEYAKAQLDLSKEFLKPDQIEAKLDAAGITGQERQDIIRRSFSDNRPADVQRYEYGQANPGFAEYEARQGAGSSKIAADIEARKAAAAEMGLRPDSPEYRSFTLTGKFPREDQQPLSATDKKAILEADEGVLGGQAVIENLRQAKTLSKKAYEGPAASWRGYGTSFLGSEAGQATLDLDNLVTTNALGQLKSIFGAAPTEGERKILLDIQGSSSLPDAARQKIYDRAIVAAERRLEFNRQRAADLRGQTYYKPQGGAGEGRGGGAGQARQPQGAAPFSRPDLEAEARRRGLIQ